MPASKATYVYCVIAAPRRPRVSRAARGLAGMGPVRVLDVDRELFVAVADAPLSRYGEAEISRRLTDLDWVSRAAVAHQAVIESFLNQTAVLPLKLFTIFTSDARAVEHIAAQRTRIGSLVKRVANHHEWGVRVMLDRGASKAPAARPKVVAKSGAAYLNRKKAQRDSATEFAQRARETVAGLYDRLEQRARIARRRAASDLTTKSGPLLLDAAFLVPHSREATFKALAAREARTLSGQGYRLSISGPWPPYSFVQD